MSSNSSRSDLVDKREFKGLIYFSTSYRILEQNNPAALYFHEAFKSFWRNGFHPSIGKYIPFSRPTEILSLSLCHAHVDAGAYSGRSKTSTKECWDSWATGIGWIRPTSDSFISYAVNSNRDVYVISYLDDKAHDLSERAEFTDHAISEAYKFYAKTKTTPLPLDQHHTLFDDCWLKDKK